MRHVHANTLVVRDILHEVIRIRLLPVSARAARAANTAQRPAVRIVVVCLHVARRTPRIGVHGLYAICFRSLSANPDLAVVVGVPDVLWRGAGTAGGLGLDGDHVVGGGVGGGSYAVA